MYRTSAPAAGAAISTRGVGLHSDELESMSDSGEEPRWQAARGTT